MADLDHLRVDGFTESQPFRSMLSVRREPAPARDRIPHGRRLLEQIGAIRRESVEISQQREALQLPLQGMTIALKISPRGHLDYKQLEWKRDGIEVLNVTERDDFDIVALFVPEGRLVALESRVRDYLNEVTRRGSPKNAPLINVIDSIRRAAFDELWTDLAPIPPLRTRRWFQLWLRELPEGPRATRAEFARLARPFQIDVEPRILKFPGRIVVAARATRAQLEKAVELLDMLAEIRSVPDTADFFLSDLTPAEQVDWTVNLIDRTFFAPDDGDTPFITLLDTGVNQGHPLLSESLAEGDMHAIHKDWSATDENGHGTQMAGLAIHGDLSVVPDDRKVRCAFAFVIDVPFMEGAVAIQA